MCEFKTDSLGFTGSQRVKNKLRDLLPLLLCKTLKEFYNLKENFITSLTLFIGEINFKSVQPSKGTSANQFFRHQITSNVLMYVIIFVHNATSKLIVVEGVHPR